MHVRITTNSQLSRTVARAAQNQYATAILRQLLLQRVHLQLAAEERWRQAEKVGAVI